MRSGALTLALVLIGLLLWALKPAKTTATAAVVPSAGPVAPAPTSIAASPQVLEPADLPTETAQASAAPVAAASPARVTRKFASKTNHTSANCVPPFVLDAQGRKRFKPECF